MTIKKTTQIFNALSLIVIVLTLLLLYLLFINTNQLMHIKEKKDTLTILASQLYGSSQDLTYRVREYVITQDPLAKQDYFDILDIRSGKKPRPIGSHIEERQTVSLITLFKQHGITDEELKYLQNSFELSESLTKKEIEAINASDGLFKDIKGGYSRVAEPDSEYAFSLVSGNEYNFILSQIKYFYDLFQNTLEIRISEEIEQHTLSLYNIVFALAFVILLELIIVSCSIIYSRKRIITPLSETTYFAKKVTAGDFSSTIAPMYLNEIGILRNTLNSMLENINIHVNELHKQTRHARNEEQKAIQAKIEAETSRIRAEENHRIAIQALETKSHFIANMSHELYTPLNAVLGFSTLCQQTSLTEQQKDYIKKIKNATYHLLDIISDVLDYADGEIKHITPENTLFDIHKVINSAFHYYIDMAKLKRIDFIIDINQNIPTKIIGDDKHLKEILFHLIENAIKFTNAGFITLSINPLVEQSNDLEYFIEFKVTDTGIGIKKEEMSQLFQPFTQIDSSFSRKENGTGMGLAICKQVLNAFGSSMNVESELGKGSVFSFILPFMLPEKIENLKEITALYQIQSLRDVRALLVEDNIINQEIALELLEQLGIKTTLAENGLKAVELVEKIDFDIILMDIQMPVMDGLEATEKIRAMGKTLPILAVSAHTAPEDKKKSIDAGMNLHITKPIDIKILEAAIIQQLNPSIQQISN